MRTEEKNFSKKIAAHLELSTKSVYGCRSRRSPRRCRADRLSPWPSSPTHVENHSNVSGSSSASSRAFGSPSVRAKNVRHTRTYIGFRDVITWRLGGACTRQTGFTGVLGFASGRFFSTVVGIERLYVLNAFTNRNNNDHNNIMYTRVQTSVRIANRV